MGVVQSARVFGNVMSHLRLVSERVVIVSVTVSTQCVRVRGVRAQGAIEVRDARARFFEAT